MGIQPENRVRKEDTGEPVFPVTGPSSIVWKGLLYLFFVHRDQWVIQNYAASAALTLIETRLSLCIILYYPLISMYNQKYKMPFQTIEEGPVTGKTGFPCVFFTLFSG